jgi:hypothetical protein
VMHFPLRLQQIGDVLPRMPKRRHRLRCLCH